ncbi:MAG: DUF3656 domain-containing protein [Lachnospiraceae bacterium]
MKKKKIELLSPAGDYECFQAALRAGADAVYLGGDKYGARAYAKNFTDKEILKAIDEAHLFGKKVYLTINTLLKNEELFELSSYLRSFYLAGVDGVIVQDLGVISLIRHDFPMLPVHASTQMAITDSEGVKLLKKLGAERVVLARELSLKEITRIYQETGIELECFIHGALCYSYSGKCLFSSLIGGRSGNRGRCAQPCRLPYNGQYPLSTKDICTLELLPQLIESGIASFKIEGRMKNPDYVAGVTGIYRKYMDAFLQAPAENYCVEQEDLKNLLLLYTRSGNSKGYFYTKNGRDMITIEKPGYQAADEKKRKEVSERYASRDSQIPLKAFARLKKGEPAMLTLTSASGEVIVSGGLTEGANNQPLTENAVRKQLEKTGGTPFAITALEIEMEPDIFIPIGQLNELRRMAITGLTDKLLEGYQRTLSQAEETTGAFEPVFSKRNRTFPTSLTVHCSVMTKEQLQAGLSEPYVDRISVPVSLFEERSEENKENYSKTDAAEVLLKSVHKAGKRLILVLPYIIRNRYFDRNQELLERLLLQCGVEGVLISNYESLFYLQEIHYSGEIIADFHLYAWNEEAQKMLKALGCTKTTVPVELNKKELLRRGIAGEELILYGRLPMMVSAQCIRNTTQGCDAAQGVLEITDRYGTKFPCNNLCKECYNVIWNSVPVSLHGERMLIERLGTDSVRMQFTTETKEQTSRILQFYNKVLYHKDGETNNPQPPFTEFTRGHLNRGVE